MSIVLRPYQEDLIVQGKQILREKRRSFLIQLATGGGKTALTASLIHRTSARGNTAWFLVHRRELIKQSMKAFDLEGIQYGVIAAGVSPNAREPVQIGSIGTVVNRMHRYTKPRLVVIDECHHLGAASWRKLYQQFPDAKIIGLSATPSRTDGQGLQEFFEVMINGPSMKDLIADGYLCPFRLLQPEPIDVKDVQVRMGDYSRGELEKAANKPKITGDAIAHYREHCEGGRNLVFAVSIKHSLEIVRQFTEAGYPAVHLDGETDPYLRDKALEDFAAGKIKIVSNVELFGEGFDCLDQETEILTAHGWRGIGQVSAGDIVASYDLKARKISMVPATRYVEREVSADEHMVSIRSQHMDIRVTEGHEFHFRTAQGYRDDGMSPSIKTLSAGDIVRRRKAICLPISGELDTDFPGVPLTDDQIRFVAWFITDGCRERSNITISQSKHPYVDEIRGLLRRLGFDFTERVRMARRGSYANAKPLHEFRIPKGNHSVSMKRIGWQPLGIYLDKNIAPLLHGMTRQQFEFFWEALLDGDGSRSANKASTLTVSSKNQKDAYMQLAVLRGYCPMHGTYKTKAGVSIYTMRIRDSQWHFLKPADARGAKFNLELPAKEERVWCVTNENSTLVTRRNGRIAILGNCPTIECVTLLRPTKSIGMYLQQVGRVLRPVYAPGVDISTAEGRHQAIEESEKPYAVILDHAGNSHIFGNPDEDREWSLVGKALKKKEVGVLPPRICGQCFASNPAWRTSCEVCGAEFKRNGREIERVDGVLTDAQKEAHERFRKIQVRKAQIEKASTREELIRISRERGHRFPEKFADYQLYVRARRDRVA